MPRIARIVVPGVAHHVTQRGNNRQKVFFGDGDRRRYLALLKEQAQRHGLRVLGYCLMSNHVHLVVIPKRADSLAKAMGAVHRLYAQDVNRRRGRSGHLWQNRFFSCPLDEAHCWTALRYVERNPVRAGLVRRPWRYRWSSALAHAGKADPSGLLHLRSWEAAWGAPSWKEWLAAESAEETAALRLSTRTGRPLGSGRFLSRLERTLGRRVRALPPGRPRKRQAAAGRR